ncbi:zeta-sarcoglycan isoform X2 [Hypanus sabinus]|uniref:zeta-sarcoglycan isoform X2 n=1 Tax=Hypanus sabinus TaxID=79690 RepID=UPI0028C47A89|nr:zeta-sarcoglycan isoform X2 [Hypanus sabinus]
MTREQYILATQHNNLQRPENQQVYQVGIYGWRKRCLYFFVLLLMVTMIVNLALTIWILKVMKFSVNGMGNLKITNKGMRLEGKSEFLLPLYVKEIHSRKDSPLMLQSDRNVTVNARNNLGQITGQLTVGPEGAVFEQSVETPHVRAESSEELKLESPTRTLTMEAPKGVHITAAEGELKASCRRELELQSTDGEIFLNAKTIRLGNIPQVSASSSSASSSNLRQTVYEVCVCPNGKLFLSPASVGSTCQSSSSICLRI